MKTKQKGPLEIFPLFNRPYYRTRSESSREKTEALYSQNILILGYR